MIVSNAAPSHRELILGIAVVVIGAAFLKFADLPTRVSVVEVRTTGIENQLNSIDSKLDRLVGRMRR